MLTISPPAYERLSKLLAGRPQDVAVRIVLRQGRARIRSSRQREGDNVVEHDGRTVLLFDREVAQHLDRRMLGVRNTEAGPRLRLQPIRPDAQP